MPETLLGLFPDALASYHMPRLLCGYSYGLYLGLLGG
jgi:enoyl-CoA hydratase/carnithine racemase